jgi:hypothetical protein
MSVTCTFQDIVEAGVQDCNRTHLSVQGVHRDVHGPQEGPDVLAVDIGHRVPLDQATSSTIQPFERRIDLHICTNI